MDKMRKIYCEERTKKGFDKLTVKELKELCGWCEPDTEDEIWTVTMVFEGQFMNFDNQQDAEIFANTEMIKGLLLKKNGSEQNDCMRKM
ncbi:MAG: hypothetical protein Q7R52_03095 [archaeon]|nr:hypothetical protein [archaeon]